MGMWHSAFLVIYNNFSDFYRFKPLILMKSKIKKKIKRMLSVLSSRVGDISLNGESLEVMNSTQSLFVEWNAERLGISKEESRKRFELSWKSIYGGHRGNNFRRFNDLSYNMYNVFVSDNENEVYNAYKFHSNMHFLRMLSYAEGEEDISDTIVKKLMQKNSISIVDYGCGLAQRSRALARLLAEHGKEVTLTLVDIPTIRKEFLLWLGVKFSIPTTFLESSKEDPIPKLPPNDICIATEFFEHVHDPVPYLKNMHESLNPGGALVTNVADHHTEFMHVSPNLSVLREKLAELQYEEIEQNILYFKSN